MTPHRPAAQDHGTLTALTSALFFDASGAPVPCPDPAAGLYVRTRGGATVRVAIPADCVAFQIGECAQVMSGGALLATPHWVRAPLGCPGVSRGTMAVFMEPEHDAVMVAPEGVAAEEVLRGANRELLPEGVPPLSGRWAAGDTFSEFTGKTLAAYY